MSLNSDWQKFLNENLDDKNIFTYIQGLQEIISNLKPRTMTEKRRLQIAKNTFCVKLRDLLKGWKVICLFSKKNLIY